MSLSPKFSSAFAATLGLCLIVGCVPSTSNTSVEKLTPTAADVEVAPATEAAPAAAEPFAEAAPADPDSPAPLATEAAPATAEVSSSIANEPLAVFAEDGIAIRGADPVAYFTEGEYVAGSSNYTHEWAGATWQFASAENRDLFASNPTQYAPQYGGFCAWAVSEGYTAPVDPNAWKIVDGKLYLNFDARIQRRWERDIPGHIARADQNWPGVVSN